MESSLSRVLVTSIIMLGLATSTTAQETYRSAPPLSQAKLRSAETEAPRTTAAPLSRVALVIGNSAYSHVPPLDTPARDTREICTRLRNLDFDVECVEEIRTRREMRAAVDRYVDRMRPGATALFYFAGHGVQKRGENFLLPTSAQINRSADIDEESLSLGYLMEASAETRVALNLVVVDACRENMVSKSMELLLPQGLAAIHAPYNTVVFYSTAPGRMALDAGRGALRTHSPFARHFLANMGTQGIALEEFFKRVTLGVQEETAGRQIPWTNSSFTGAFCFASCPDSANSAELERVTAEKSAVERKLIQLESDRALREREIESLAARIQSLEAQTAERQRDLQIEANRDQSSTSSLIEQHRKLQQEYDELQRANEQLYRQRARLEEQSDEARHLEAVSRDLSVRIKQVEQLEAENAELRRQASLRAAARQEAQAQQAPQRRIRGGFAPAF